MVFRELYFISFSIEKDCYMGNNMQRRKISVILSNSISSFAISIINIK